MEGGPKDRFGLPVRTIEDFREHRAAYVAVAADLELQGTEAGRAGVVMTSESRGPLDDFTDKLGSSAKDGVKSAVLEYLNGSQGDAKVKEAVGSLNKAEAVVEYNSRKREGAAVVMWSPEEQRWEPPQAAQGLTKPCACAARR
ncbi:MAG: hypothetical protein JNM40_24655 [Myxococcales bacterium]|nr:hypothetical protein [Myxococcales bacterium]